MTGEFNPTMMLSILPEISLLALISVVLALDLLLRQAEKGRYLGLTTIAGLVVIISASILFAQPPMQPQLVWGGMLRWDSAAFVFQLIFLVGAALTSLFAMEEPVLGEKGEFYILLLISALGMCLMAASADLIMLYLAIETTSIPLYILAGFMLRDKKSVEAGVKYLLFGAMTSAVMLYSFSLLYGFTGTTQIYQLAQMLQAGQVPVFTLAVVVVLVMVGFGFKISAVPFHFWAPDVYEGSAAPVAGFLSTASKAAGFVVLMRVLLGVFPGLTPTWTLLVAALATASMFTGNFLALAQKNIKRLLAYSSIAQAGYILIGVAAGSQLGISGSIYYLMAYLLTNLAAFGIVTIVAQSVGSNLITAYAGLSRRSPGLALAMLAAMLSLGGIPPFAGFVGKLLVLAAAVQAGMAWLALIGVLNAIIALYYYLTVLKVIYLYHTEEEDKPLAIARPWALALAACILGIVVLGVVVAPAFAWATSSAVTLLGH